MDDDASRAYHWQPEDNRWVEIDWDDFCAFREMFKKFRPLKNIAAGVHNFAVVICGEEQVWNIIPHKYLIEPTGKVGRDNFYGWNREEREDYNRLMLATERKPGEQERLHQIQDKGGAALYPPRESLYPLVRALPFDPRPDSAATQLLDAIALGKSRSQLKQAS